MFNNYKQMWSQIEAELLLISSDAYNEDLPHLKLFIAIIIEAGKDKDIEYFTNGEFKKHVYFLRLNEKFVLGVIAKAWKLIKSNKSWVYTSFTEYDEWGT